MATVTVTLELPEEVVAQIDTRARHENRTREEIIAEMCSTSDDLTEEQWELVELGLAAEKAGNFASPERMEGIYQKYRESK